MDVESPTKKAGDLVAVSNCPYCFGCVGSPVKCQSYGHMPRVSRVALIESALSPMEKCICSSSGSSWQLSSNDGQAGLSFLITWIPSPLPSCRMQRKVDSRRREFSPAFLLAVWVDVKRWGRRGDLRTVLYSVALVRFVNRDLGKSVGFPFLSNGKPTASQLNCRVCGCGSNTKIVIVHFQKIKALKPLLRIPIDKSSENHSRSGR